MHLRSSTVPVGLAALTLILALGGCASGTTTGYPREELVRLPPSTGTMLARWVPKSQIANPTIAPEIQITSMQLRRLVPTGSLRGL